jgi:hypothetical protein
MMGTRSISKTILSVGLLMASSQSAFCETQPHLFDIIRGLAQQGMVSSAQSSWEKVALAEVACVDRRLKARGASLDEIVRSGILPTDSKIANIRAECRKGALKSKKRVKRTGDAVHPKTDPPISSSRTEASNPPPVQSEVESAAARETAAKTAAEQVQTDRLAAAKVAEKAETDRAESEATSKATAERAATDEVRRREEVLIERTRSAGVQYAKDSGAEWKLIQSHNDTNGRTIMSVESIQRNASGALVHVTGTCESSTAHFYGLTLDTEGNEIEYLGRNRAGEFSAQLRVNDSEPRIVTLTAMERSNKAKLAAVISENSRSDFVDMVSAIVSGNYFENRKTWRIVIELKSDRGLVVVKIPTYDPNVQQFIASCIAKQ